MAQVYNEPSFFCFNNPHCRKNVFSGALLDLPQLKLSVDVPIFTFLVSNQFPNKPLNKRQSHRGKLNIIPTLGL